MLIRSPGAPADGVSTIGPAVAHLMSRGPDALPAMGGAAPVATQPLRLFGLRLDQIKDDSFLNSATPIGWRYLIVSNGPIAVADVKAGSGQQGSNFHRLIRGELAQRLDKASELAQKRYANDPDSFEVRILEIPSLYMAALWLHGQRDVFIPLLEGGEANRRDIGEDTAFVSHVLQSAAARRAAP